MTPLARERLVVLAPALFAATPGGVEAVSRFLAGVAGEFAAKEPYLISANEAPEQCGDPQRGTAFGGRYTRLLWWCLRHSRRRVGASSGIVCAHAGLLPAARLLARSLRCPYVVYLHGLEVWRAPRWQESWGGRNCTGVMANSAYTLRRAAEAQPWISRVPSIVTPLGLLFPVAPEGLNEVSRRQVVLAVGQVRLGEISTARGALRYGKGFDVLLDSFARLRGRNHLAKLEIITGGNGVDALRQDVGKRGLGEAVSIRENVSVEELDAAYRRARIFCLPSEQEGFGLVFVEAMARGTPCVGVDAGAVPEILRDGECGFVVPRGNSEVLAEKLQLLLADLTRWQRHSDQALTDVRDRFSLSAVRERHAAAFSKLLRLN